MCIRDRCRLQYFVTFVAVGCTNKGLVCHNTNTLKHVLLKYKLHIQKVIYFCLKRAKQGLLCLYMVNISAFLQTRDYS